MPELRKREGVAALALEFAILTACRSGEVRGLRWEEIDLNARIWSIPARRMKSKQAHQVPLTPRMMAILTMIAPLNDRDGFVFPSQRAGRPLSDMSLSAVLRRMKVDCTVHGFRSSFRDWAGSATSFPRELAEEALAHVIGNQTERAYRREAALERRRELMLAWESYLCAPAGENIVPLRRERGL
jgi:integrase